jgi:3-isopropylmalate/(R)-2-methylmalate dehydratase small subunit
MRPEFAAGVQPGDVIVAGPNFGIGSSREQAAAVLVHLGVAAVIAPSYSGLYFRNAFNVGLLLLTCAEAETLSEGEQIALDTSAPEIVAPGARRLACEPVPGFLMDMVRAGGLLNQLRQRSGRPAFTKAPDA